MQLLKTLFFILIFVNSAAASAFVLSDVREFNAPLVYGQTAGFNFNLADHGYNHLTDTITNVKLSLDFREIVETEEDMENLDDMSTWEFIIFYSRIFDGRSVYADIDTGTITFETDWIKTSSCQYTDYWNGEEICFDNLDLYGEMSTSFVPYTDNLWLGEARLDAEITRISVPEPAPLLLLGLGLLVLTVRYKRLENRNKIESQGAAL